MIIEGRTIKTIAEMQEFCAAAIAATHADPSTIRLHKPQDMRGGRTCFGLATGNGRGLSRLFQAIAVA